ncbi:hypothetical protein ABIB45_004130 [Arthrobacter sp. UYCo732]
MLPRMPYFVEYVTDQAVGHSVIYCVKFADALSEAKDALLGLHCTSAVLRHIPGSNPAFGEGPVLAIYTPAEGWRILDVGRQ